MLHGMSLRCSFLYRNNIELKNVSRMPEDVTNNIGEKVWREFITLQQTLESLDWFYGSARWSNNRWRILQHNFYDDLSGNPTDIQKNRTFCFYQLIQMRLRNKKRADLLLFLLFWYPRLFVRLQVSGGSVDQLLLNLFW